MGLVFQIKENRLHHDLAEEYVEVTLDSYDDYEIIEL